MNKIYLLLDTVVFYETYMYFYLLLRTLIEGNLSRKHKPLKNANEKENMDELLQIQWKIFFLGKIFPLCPSNLSFSIRSWAEYF